MPAARSLGNVLQTNPYCAPLQAMYSQLVSAAPTSWNQAEVGFLDAMSRFDGGLPAVLEGSHEERRQQSQLLSAALQNGKGDWFNNVIALLLEGCSGVETLYVRRRVPGLIIPEHNLDGVYPGDETREIGFLLEAKMMGTPKHANSPAQAPGGRNGSADTNKRVKELAFKAIDLKGEAARRRAMVGIPPVAGGAGGGDLSTWLHGSRPSIYFFMAVRVLRETDFRAVVRWAETAAQVVDAVGLYCYEPVPGSFTTYRPRSGVPTPYELERVLFRACNELQHLSAEPPPPIPPELPKGPSAEADALTSAASDGG